MLGNFHHRRILLLILIVGLFLRVVLVVGGGDLVDSSDAAHWDGTARAYWLTGLLHTDGGTYRPPLFPLMLAAVYGLVGHQVEFARLVQTVIGTLTCLVCFALGRRLGGAGTGLVAAALAALYPLFILFSTVLMAETLLIALVGTCLWLGARWEEQSTAGSAACLGVGIGLAALCKPVVLAWLPFLIGGRLRRSGQWRHALVVLLAAGLVILPWSLRNLAQTGHFVPISSNVGVNLFIGHEPEAAGGYRAGVDYFALAADYIDRPADPVLLDRMMALQALRWIAADPLRTVGLGLRKLLIFWSPAPAEVGPLEVLIGLATTGPLLALGCTGAWQLRHRTEVWHLLSLALALSLVHMIFFSHTRFRLPVDVALIAPAAFGLIELWKRWLRP